MVTLHTTITLDDAAFTEDLRSEELGRILRRQADRVEAGYTSGVMLDTNGNSAGDWCIDEDDNGDDPA
ncbi:hypothetical protein LCGC14_0445340 [marine sediment metagenome]|uniref:Uncharacterized protein n=1 Tax=marine sediment metagenome TaxID=412755 RepID=A0A0F9T2K1_9ZZZZ